MKKGIALAMALVMAFLLTGCSGKSTLVCTQTQSSVDITFNVGFDGNKISSMDFGYDMDVSKYSDAQLKILEKKDFCSVVKLTMSAYKDAFTKCGQKISDKHLNVDAVLDVNKIAKSERDKMTSVDEAKKALEKQGYKCTIKK